MGIKQMFLFLLFLEEGGGQGGAEQGKYALCSSPKILKSERRVRNDGNLF